MMHVNCEWILSEWLLRSVWETEFTVALVVFLCLPDKINIYPLTTLEGQELETTSHLSRDRSLGLLPFRVYTSFLPGSYVTSYRVVVIHRLIC